MSKHKSVWVSVAMSVLALVGWTLHWHLTINNSAPVITKPAASQQDGKVWTAQCLTVKAGTPEYQVAALYGMPQGDTEDNGSSDMFLQYPLEEDGHKFCTIDFDLVTHKVNEVEIDLLNVS